MNTPVTPEQVQNLLFVDMLILLVVLTRLLGMAVYHKWLKNLPGSDLSQEELDLRLVQRHKGRR